MAKATIGSLNESERLLVAETSREALRGLDEDALVALHDRVRKARTKHVQLHRRQAAAAVESKGARSGAPRRDASKAEIFEDALARVSTALAAAARRSAAELRAERLAAAPKQAGRTAKATPAKAPATAKAAKPTAGRARAKQPAERKSVAASRATGARRQATKDARSS